MAKVKESAYISEQTFRCRKGNEPIHPVREVFFIRKGFEIKYVVTFDVLNM